MASEALDRFLEGLSVPPESLTQKERAAIAGVAYRNLVGRFEDDPGEIGAGADIGWEEFSSRLKDGLRYFNPHGDGIADPLYNPILGLAVLEPDLALDELLQSLGIHSLAPGDRVALAEDVAVALRDACTTLLRRVRRDFGKDSMVERFPAFVPRALPVSDGSAAKTPSEPVGLDAIFAPWAKEHETDGGVPETRKAWREVLERFAASCSTVAPGRWTQDNVADWVAQRLTAVKRSTIYKQDLPALQAIFDVAKSKGLMTINPVRDFREGRKKRGELMGWMPPSAGIV